MKTLKYHHFCFALAFFVVFLLPFNVFAEVVPLAPLPTNFGTNTETLGGYVSTIFFLTISAGAILAVLRIIWGGFRYMTSEAVGDVKEARLIITRAIIGLVLLLTSWLILYQINPDIVELRSLEFDSIGSSTSQSDINSVLGDLFGGPGTDTRAENPNAPTPSVPGASGTQCVKTTVGDLVSHGRCYPSVSECEREISRRIEGRNTEGAVLECCSFGEDGCRG